jgi:hypothetical protein
MNMPGFTAERSLDRTINIYRRTGIVANFPSKGSKRVMPQLRFQPDPDVGEYWRYRANGGSDLICRFFAGLPPFTIGGLLT